MHLDGYKYWLAYTKGAKSYYRCSRSKSQKCPGKLIMENSKVITMVSHDHEKESRNNVVEKFRKVLTKKAIEKPNKALVDIYVEETLNHSEASILYPFSQAESTMRKARSKILEEKRKAEENCEVGGKIEDKKAAGDGNCSKNEEIEAKNRKNFKIDEKIAKTEEIFEQYLKEKIRKIQTKTKEQQNAAINSQKQQNASINSQQHQKYFYVENVGIDLKIILMNQGTLKILGKIEEIHIDCGMKVDVKEAKARQEQEILSQNVINLENYIAKNPKSSCSNDIIQHNEQTLTKIHASPEQNLTNQNNVLATNQNLRLSSFENSMQMASNYSFLEQNLQHNATFSNEISLVNYENVSLVYESFENTEKFNENLGNIHPVGFSTCQKSYSLGKNHFVTLEDQNLSNITSKDQASSYITSKDQNPNKSHFETLKNKNLSNITSKDPASSYVTSENQTSSNITSKNQISSFITSNDPNPNKNHFVTLEDHNMSNITSKAQNPNTSQLFELKTTEISTEQPMIIDFEMEKQAIGSYNEINIDFTPKNVEILNYVESTKNNETFTSESDNLTQNSSQVQYFQEFIVSYGENSEIFDQNQQNLDKSFQNNFESPQILVQNFHEGLNSHEELKIVGFEVQGPENRNTEFLGSSKNVQNSLENFENSQNFQKSSEIPEQSHKFSETSKIPEHNLNSKIPSNFSGELLSSSNPESSKHNLKYEAQRYRILTVIALIKGRDCPIAFGLIKSKNFELIHQFLQLLKLKIALNPTIILTNQNEILQQALSSVWPEATMKIMYFYYAKSVLKNLQKNFQEITKNIFEISSLKMILSMPLIPTNYVIPGWEALRKWMNEKNVDLNQLCDDVYVKWLAENAERISIFNGLTHSINNHTQVFQTELINSFDGLGMKTENLIDKILRQATKNFTKFSKTSEISAKKIQKLQKTVKIATKSWISSPFHLRRPIQFLQQVSHCIDDGMINFVMNFDGNFIEVKKLEPPPLIFFAKEQNLGEKRENLDKRNKMLLSSEPPPLVPIKR